MKKIMTSTHYSLKFGSEVARISATLFSRRCHRAIFFTLASPRLAPPLIVRASGAVALQVAQVPSWPSTES